MGGNRKGPVRLVINIFVVWFLTGLWHGASWNFIIWGLFFFVLLVLEKFLYLDKLEKNKIAGHIYMLFIIPLSWTIFAITDIKTLGMYIRKMFLIPVAGGAKCSYYAEIPVTFRKILVDAAYMCILCNSDSYEAYKTIQKQYNFQTHIARRLLAVGISAYPGI